jgi:iron complex transport system substrate-binding protein
MGGGFGPAALCRSLVRSRGARRSRGVTSKSRLLLFLALCATIGGGRATSATLPHRVVALAPNLTEIVFAVGAGESLVGVSDYSDFPPRALSLPRVGGLDVSAERVASLRPDLVLATAEGNARGPVTALSAAGVPVLVVPGGSLDAVLQGIRLVGGRLGRGKEAERLAERLSRRRRAVRESLSGLHRPRAVLLVWPDPPQAAGGETFLNDVLSEAGAENLLVRRRGWPLVSSEWLATAPIEVLVVPNSEQTRPAYERAFATGSLSRGAVARALVVRVEESVLTRPGPRVFDALEQLARELRR